MAAPGDPIDRRHFLAVVAGLVAAGCSPEVVTSTTTSTAGTTTAGTASSEPTSTTDTESTSSPAQTADITGVEPLAAPTLAIDADPFVLGVAAGDPDDTSVVLWTRLVHDDLPETVEFVWEVAADSGFETLLATDIVRSVSSEAHTVRVVVEPGQSASTFHYRFRAGDFTSGVGRATTLPDPDDITTPLALAFTSCQLLETGHFAAHRDIAESDVDLVVWLGDYIYEGGGSSTLDGRTHVPPTVSDLDGYRSRYAQYRADPHLKAAHAAHPWMVLWDDHEVLNDYDATVNPEQRRAAYQAWWEHMPTRLAAPSADGLNVHRSLRLGGMATLVGIDVRQFASPDGLLGDGQWGWLEGELRQAAGATTWTLMASPVLVSGLITSLDANDDPLLPYTFDGAPDERTRLAGLLAATNSVVVSGDLHTGMVLDLRPDPRGPASTTVAAEFMAPAISSAFPAAFADNVGLLPLVNPQMRDVDTTNGWLRLDVTAADVTATFRHVADVRSPDSIVDESSQWIVRPGSPHAERLG